MDLSISYEIGCRLATSRAVYSGGCRFKISARSSAILIGDFRDSSQFQANAALALQIKSQSFSFIGLLIDRFYLSSLLQH